MGMTRAERNNKLRHFITCLKCEVSGKCCDDNCLTQYEAGTMGEIIENLEAISKALEQEPTTKNDLGVDCISRADARKAIIDHQYSDSFCEEHNIDYSINTGMALITLSDLPPVTPQEPFIHKPCVSSGVCEHDKQKVLDKIRAEIEKDAFTDVNNSKFIFVNRVNQIFDKYKAETEEV